MKIKFYILFGMLFSFQSFFSQVKTTNTDIWLHYVCKNMLNKKLSVTLEASMRYANGFDEKQQWFIRPSVDYQFTKSFNGSLGATYYDTYVYGEVPLNKVTTPEKHLWLQGIYAKTFGNYKFTHRLRDEHRWVGIASKNSQGNFEITDYVYRNRLRYMFLANYALIKKDDKTKLFAMLGDEVFMNIAVKDAKTFLQQNRVIAGLGYNLNANHQLQLSYIHQTIWNLGNTIQENNPTVRLSYVTNFDWYKKE
ncbi:MAG: DUF2490 domain-containing protein [Limnohabitans sp.]|nr:DUF2490 domain-containing protein [Limnohabitans sp.]